jgi:tetratricopeptide (TPR) repeat protein
MILVPAVLQPADPVTVLVFPLESPAKVSALAWIGEGFAVSLSDELRMPGVDVVDQSDRMHLVENADLPPNAPLSRASMIRVGQLASADLVVMGTCSGSVDNLQISLHVFDIRSMKLSGEMSANGPLSAVTHMENELAWNILANTGLNKIYSREKFKERTRTIPDSAFSYYVRSLGASDEEERIKLLEKAVSLHQNFPDAQYQLGRYYFQKGQYSGAVQHLELGRKSDRTYLHGDFMLGTCYLESNSVSDAIRCYTNLLSFARPIEALNNLGVAHLRQGDLPLALQDLLEAHNLARNNSTVALNLALLRHLQGNESAARTVLEESIKVYPGNGMLQLVLSLVLSVSGDKDKAALAVARAKSLGVDVEKLQSEDPKSWARIFISLEHRP